jgi:hypothetical protein
VEALVNDNMLPFIFNVASYNGQFDVGTCLAEAWLRARNGNAPTGAIAAYMASGAQYWEEPLVAQQEFIGLYVNEAYTSFGTLCFAGSCRMMDEYASTGVTMFNTWILFGDPSLRIVGAYDGLRPDPIPTVSTWGLATMLLLVLIAGTLVFLRRSARAYA